jgi:hypothetical protein
MYDQSFLALTPQSQTGVQHAAGFAIRELNHFVEKANFAARL